MLDCPSCKNKLGWQIDWDCEVVFGCDCEEGLTSYHYCAECDDLYTYTTGCKNRDERELKKVEMGEEE